MDRRKSRKTGRYRLTAEERANFAREQMSERKRRKSGRKRLTAEDRAKYARERRELIGKLIIQDGWEGAIVLEHVRGSQYIVRLADGREVYASHKKQKDQQKQTVATQAGWRLWEEK